jgi:small-conductance mechanosensitive channel
MGRQLRHSVAIGSIKGDSMKSMIVVSESSINKHVGEEYDIIVEVPYEPTTENIQACAEKVLRGIKELWNDQEGLVDRKIVVHLDAATPFGVMLENLQIILKAESGTIIDLPWCKPTDVADLDSESKTVLNKLDGR